MKPAAPRCFLSLLFALLAGHLSAESWHVDFVGGADANDGLTPATAFQHCPGDPAAKDKAATAVLAPGDTVLFKGGVVYRGAVTVKVSGQPGKPIIFDGNTAGTYGSGVAVIDGGNQISAWKRCASAAEAKDNPRWAEIFYADLPRPKTYKDLNLCDATSALPIAQQPNPKDFFWQEHATNYLTAPGILKPVGGLRIAADKGTQEDKQQPITNLLTGNLAVVSPVPGSGFTYTLEKAEEVVAVGIAVQPKYAALNEVAVLGDGKELMRLKLAKDDKGKIQRFELPAPISVAALGFRFLSLHEGEKGDWSKLKQVAAFTKSGANLLAGSDTMTFTDPVHINQPQADWYDGMTFAFHAGNNAICYVPIKGYDPATHTLNLGVFADTQYKETVYCLFNSVRLIDAPGEYSVEETADAKTARVFLLPPALVAGQPADIAGSARANGFEIDGASHITIQGFLLRRQNGSALNAHGPAVGIIFRDCEATLVNGTVISAAKIDDILVERCHIHTIPATAKGWFSIPVRRLLLANAGWSRTPAPPSTITCAVTVMWWAIRCWRISARMPMALPSMSAVKTCWSSAITSRVATAH